MERVIISFLCGFVCVFFSPCVAVAGPVSLDFIYVGSYAEAYAEVAVDGDIPGFAVDNPGGSGLLEAYALAETQAQIETSPGTWDTFYGDTDAYAAIFDLSGPGFVAIGSQVTIGGSSDSPYSSDHYGDGMVTMDGILQVGISASFPAGSGGLSLEVYLDMFLPLSPGYSEMAGCVVGLFSDDLANPIDVVLDESDVGTLTTIDVLAGQQIEFFVGHYFEAESLMGPLDAANGMVVDVGVVPEPATILMIGFGIPIISRLRRKRRLLPVL